MDEQKSAEVVVAAAHSGEGPNMRSRVGSKRSMRAKVAEDLNPVIRGWVAYFRMSDVRVSFEELDGWDAPRAALRAVASVEASAHASSQAHRTGPV